MVFTSDSRYLLLTDGYCAHELIVIVSLFFFIMLFSDTVKYVTILDRCLLQFWLSLTVLCFSAIVLGLNLA